MLEWIRFAQDLVATLIGAGVGFWFALQVERIGDARRERKDRNNAIASILQELDHILNGLDLPAANFAAANDSSGEVTVDLDIPYFPTAAFEASVHSGKFAMLEVSLQGDLATAYEQVAITRIVRNDVVRFYARPLDVPETHKHLSNLLNHLHGHSQMLRTLIEPLQVQLRAVSPKDRYRSGQAGDSHSRLSKNA
jgi:hypothetical protein